MLGYQYCQTLTRAKDVCQVDLLIVVSLNSLCDLDWLNDHIVFVFPTSSLLSYLLTVLMVQIQA